MFGFIAIITETLLPGLGNALKEVLQLGVKVINALAKAVTAFAEEMGIIETKDPEELGDKCIQAEEAGIKPENFETYDEYAKAIDNFEVDKEKAANTPLEDKLAKATQHSLEALNNKFPDADVLNLAKGVVENPEFFENTERFTELAKLVGNDPEKVANIGKLLCGKLEGDEYYDTIDMIASAEQALFPDLSPKEIQDKVKELLNGHNG